MFPQDLDKVKSLVFEELLKGLLAGSLEPQLHLDLLEVADQRSSAGVKQKLAEYRMSISKGDPLAAYRPTLFGGDAEWFHA